MRPDHRLDSCRFTTPSPDNRHELPRLPEPKRTATAMPSGLAVGGVCGGVEVAAMQADGADVFGECGACVRAVWHRAVLRVARVRGFGGIAGWLQDGSGCQKPPANRRQAASFGARG